MILAIAILVVVGFVMWGMYEDLSGLLEETELDEIGVGAVTDEWRPSTSVATLTAAGADVVRPFDWEVDAA